MTAKRPIVLAASRGPYAAVARRLSKKGHRVVFLRRPSQLTAAALERIGPSLVFLPHWSYLVPPAVFEGHECVVFHMTDVPYGRGGSPLQNLIARGRRSTKISALRCGPVLDGGPVYLKRPLSLAGTADEILSRAAVVIEGMIEAIVRGTPRPRPQKGRVVRFRRRRPEESRLTGNESIARLHDFIRMLDGEGYPRAFIELGKLRFEFAGARLTGGAVEANVTIRRKK